MKTSLLFLSAAMAVTTLAACGKQAGAPSPSGAGTPPATSPAPTPPPPATPAPTTPPPMEEKKK